MYNNFEWALGNHTVHPLPLHAFELDTDPRHTMITFVPLMPIYAPVSS